MARAMDFCRRFRDADTSEAQGVAQQVDNGSTSETANLLREAPRDGAFADGVVKKLHKRILPFTAIIVMLSYLDRGNLGFVAADVCRQLNMNHTRYGTGVALFGVGYVTSQLPSNYFLRKAGATLWFALLLVWWGAVAASFSFVQSRGVFYILRLLLGLAEGGTFPGIWYYLSTFFPADRLNFPFSTIEASISIGSPIASPVAAGLLSLDGLFGFSGWRLLFFVEGVFPILYGGVIYWLLPVVPEKASFLDAEEKQWLREQHHYGDQQECNLLQEVRTVLSKKDFWIIVFNGFIRGALLTAAFYWTTLIIDDMLNGDEEDDDDDSCATSKSTNIASVTLTAIPFTISAVFSLCFGHVTKNLKNRSHVAGWMMAVSGVFLFCWVIFKDISFVVGLLSLSFAISLFIAPNALIVGLVSSYFDSETRASAIALFNALSAIGQIVGPLIIGLVVDHQGYGMAVTLLASAAVTGGMALLTLKDPLLTPQQKNEDASETDHP